ncbi:MAG: hypothetical protein DRP09_13785 [Candidatus Thorarchaeota archaeon]|nr:MAG: hypothetical protein DRP09_13785 [Candidatus Thorarchaeota archaeon]
MTSTAFTITDFTKLIDPYTEIVVVAPWNGLPVPVTIRMLDSVSLTSCGEFNTASEVIEKEETDKEVDLENIIRAKNIHENLLKLALVHPTFNELESYLKTNDFYTQAKKEVEEIRALIDTLDSQADKQEHSSRLELLELSLAFVLPEDFTSYIVTVLLQKEATDINKLTRDTLLQAGFLGEKYNKRPSEFIEGIFTKKNAVDIDVTALALVADYRDQKKVEKGSMKWIRGGKK